MSEIKPVLNQIEINPFFTRKKERELMRELGVVAQAWAPFAQGKQGIFTNALLGKVATKHGVSVARVILSYVLSLGVTAVVKSSQKERMAQNFKALSLSLDNEDKLAIASLERGESAFFDHDDVERIKWLSQYKV